MKRYDNIRSVIEEDFSNLGEAYDGFLIGVTEKSASHTQHKGVYDGTPEFIAQLERDARDKGMLSEVVVLMQIDKMNKAAFWDAVKEPIPFIEGYNEAVLGLAVGEAGNKVAYELTKFKEVGRSLREFSHASLEGKKASVDTADQIIGTDLGPSAPVFLTRVYREAEKQLT